MASAYSISGFREMSYLPKNFSVTDPFVSSSLLVLLCFSPLPNLFSILRCLLIFHSICSSSHFIILTLPLTSVPLTVLHWSQALHIWCGTGKGWRFSSRLLYAVFGAYISFLFSMAGKWIYHLSCNQNCWTGFWWNKKYWQVCQEKASTKTISFTII